MRYQGRTKANAESVYLYLLEEYPQGKTKKEILKDVDLLVLDGQSKESAFEGCKGLVRQMAQQDGYFIPSAVAGNGFRYTLADSADKVVESWATNTRRARGLDRLSRKHEDAINRLRSTMTPEMVEVFDMHQDQTKKTMKLAEDAEKDTERVLMLMASMIQSQEAEQAETVV